MRKGEIWTAAAGQGYAGQPRPSVILQDDCFVDIDSVTICAFTTDDNDSPLFRLLVQPEARNGLIRPSRLMVDKIVTVPRSKMGRRIGLLSRQDIVRLHHAVIVFLGLRPGSPIGDPSEPHEGTS